MHIHTTFSDGRLTPQQAADLYEELGFDFITYADHDHLIKPGYRQAIAVVNTNMIVFYGIELTIRTRFGYVHVTRIEGVNETLHVFNHPADYGLPIKQTMACIDEVALQYQIDAVEISHQGFYTPYYDRELITYPKVATDDSHHRMACGRAWIELECLRNKDSILQGIKKGEGKNFFVRGVHKAMGNSLEQ